MPQTRYNEGDQSIARARELRRNFTPAEHKLWSILRGAALDGFKFHRQQRLETFFGDFVCQSVRLSPRAGTLAVPLSWSMRGIAWFESPMRM